MTAYFVGKAYGVNLQEERSKNLGARNAGSVIGKGAFLWTFLGDSLKGVLIVGAGRLLHFEEWEIVLGASLGMIGHMFPFWLKFNGGKGVATFIGVGLALSPSLFFMMVVGSAITLSVTRSLTLSMLGGFLFYVGIIFYTDKLMLYFPILVAMILMIFKHMSNIKEALKKRK
ncbi:glycerol-3-phosphate acyltransferase [Lysinibacillus sp. NPDC094403]|uniref:glycerol-3-phosphate acyltransferase n=1 Tax=Lysinibacillus sp. NPDC094403 TaxID=3390581 RepID=UPI003CFEE023